MAFERFLLAALTLAVVSSHPVESDRNRYGNRQAEPHAVPLLTEATDPVLQVNEPRRHPVRIEKETKAAAEAADSGRAKRGFSRWTEGQARLRGYQSFTMWKPPIYQLSRPYYIPVYGSPGRVPIYFPPQAINPGTPVDNPLPNRPFTGPSYLPPKEYTPPSITTEQPMNFTNRFNEYDEEEDDRPIWSESPSGTTTTTTTSRPSNIIPTRPPRPPVMTDFPPLVHSPGSTNKLAAEDSPREKSESESFVAPPRAPSTTRRPSAGPSNCVWAIVSCCSAVSTTVPENCFEQRGCPGPFWGSSPCDSDNARAAMAAALNYYNQ